jgi:tRNA A37 methylthiotransferase MiaB
MATTTRATTDTARIGLVSLGCPKNLVDSEEMLGALADTGRAELVGDPPPRPTCWS